MWLSWALSCLLLIYNTRDETQNPATKLHLCVCLCAHLFVCGCESERTTNYSWLLFRTVYFEKDMMESHMKQRKCVSV